MMISLLLLWIYAIDLTFTFPDLSTIKPKSSPSNDSALFVFDMTNLKQILAQYSTSPSFVQELKSFVPTEHIYFNSSTWTRVDDKLLKILSTTISSALAVTECAKYGALLFEPITSQDFNWLASQDIKSFWVSLDVVPNPDNNVFRYISSPTAFAPRTIGASFISPPNTNSSKLCFTFNMKKLAFQSTDCSLDKKAICQFKQSSSNRLDMLAEISYVESRFNAIRSWLLNNSIDSALHLTSLPRINYTCTSSIHVFSNVYSRPNPLSYSSLISYANMLLSKWDWFKKNLRFLLTLPNLAHLRHQVLLTQVAIFVSHSMPL